MTTYSAAVSNNNSSTNESNSIKATNLVRFLNDPKDFSGQVIATRSDRMNTVIHNRIESNPLVWLKKLERLRDLARLADKELLLIAADHLVGKAEIWFDIACPTIETWAEFSTVFKKKFCTGLEDIWWRCIYNKKQEEGESVEDVDIELRELFSLVGLKDEHIMVRHFMDAIHPTIAWEVERKSEISASSSLEQMVEAAVKAESVMKKYHVKYTQKHTELNRQRDFAEDYEDSSDSGDSLSSPIVKTTPLKESSASDSQSSTGKMDKLLNEFNDLKISMLKIQGNNQSNQQYYHPHPNPAPNNSYPRTQVCFFCNQPGHIKTNCEEFKAHIAGKQAQQQQQQSPATGANAEPIAESSGKGKDLDSVATTPKPINSVRLGKRVRGKQGQAIKVRKPRQNRKLTVTVKKLNVWDVLRNTNSNLSISDWLSVDKTATKDLLDGIKTLRARKKTKTEHADGQIHISPTENQQEGQASRNMLINRVDIGARSTDLLFGDSTDDDPTDSSYTTEESSLESGSTSSSDITPFEEIGKYEELDPAYESKTYGSYPYSINHILNSSPLKTMVSIEGQMVEAIIDCGAATSVISASLCDRLNLQLTGDVVKVSPFDSVEKKACNMTRDVPIEIGGFTRREHCCVRQPDIVITKKLNLDPRKYRKEISKDGRTVDVYPRKQEEYLILGNTFLNAYEMRVDMATNVLSFPIFGGVNSTQVQCYSSEINPEALEILSLEVDKTRNQVPYAEELLENKEKEESVVISSNGELNLEKVPEYLQPLVRQYAHCFAEISGFGRVKGVSHKINLIPDAKPLRARPYKMSWSEAEDLDQEIARLLQNDVIEPCLGRFTSPCFFIPKSDGTNRLVIDYRALNKITEPENFVLPPLSSMVDTLAGARYYSCLDCVSGFHQLELADELSKDATGFVTPKGVWRYKTLSFGLRNAPIAFNRMMLSLFGDFVGVFLHLWVDDYLVYSATEEDHHRHLKLILERCEQVNLRLKFSKCTFGADSVSYLGHTLSEEGLSPMQTNVDKVLSFQEPKNQDQIRSFLGTTNYYHAFIQDYAKIAKPLTALLKKGARFAWNQSCQESFDHLKQALVKAPILDYPCRDKTMILTTDASTTHLGCILSQSDDGSKKNETVIAYNSRTLSDCERNYAAVHLEALAVIWAVQKYRHYLSYKPFKLRTDSAAVAFILKPDSHKSNSKLQRWNAIMQEYDYTIEHIKGTENPSDSLSRLVTSS